MKEIPTNRGFFQDVTAYLIITIAEITIPETLINETKTIQGVTFFQKKSVNNRSKKKRKTQTVISEIIRVLVFFDNRCSSKYSIVSKAKIKGIIAEINALNVL